MMQAMSGHPRPACPERRMTQTYDVAIIGAGVVGCAIARRLTLDGARVVVLEKGADILDGASKANSAILHTGFDAPEGSVELACIQQYETMQSSLDMRAKTRSVRRHGCPGPWDSPICSN